MFPPRRPHSPEYHGSCPIGGGLTDPRVHDPRVHDQERHRGTGLRVTEQRACVLTQVRRHQHADAETLARATREQLGKVSTQAVYDVLGALTDAGIIRRIEPAASRQPERPSQPERGIRPRHRGTPSRP